MTVASACRLARVWFCLSCAITAPAIGQERLLSSPVTVAIIGSLPEHRQRFAEYEAIIVRRADVGDLIVIQEPNATAAVLDAATRTLLRVRAAQIQRREPDGQYKGRAAAEVTIGVRRSVAPADWQRRNGPKAEEVVKKLKAAPYRSIDGFGQVRALSFYPPRVSR